MVGPVAKSESIQNKDIQLILLIWNFRKWVGCDPYKTMVHYDICQNSNEPLSCMGAKASQPTHFLKFQLTGFQLSKINCIPCSKIVLEMQVS